MSDLKVFVYGTLLSGQGNNFLLEDSTFLGKSNVQGLEMHSLGAFPACVLSDESEVVGEVWEIDEHTLGRLDGLEGYPRFYDRIEVETSYGQAWVYINEKARTLPLIECGDWKEYIRESDGD